MKNTELNQIFHTLPLEIEIIRDVIMLSPIGFGVTAFAIILSIDVYFTGQNLVD